MAEEKEYKVMLIDRSVDSTKFIFENIDKDLKMYERAYASEMSMMNYQPIEMFTVTDNQICVAFTKEFEVLGFISFSFDQTTRSLYIEHVYVVPAYRRKKVFSNMMKRMEVFAQKIKADKMISFVYNTNKESLAAHTKLCFRPTMTTFFKEVAYDKE